MIGLTTGGTLTSLFKKSTKKSRFIVESCRFIEDTSVRTKENQNCKNAPKNETKRQREEKCKKECLKSKNERVKYLIKALERLSGIVEH